ncbi:hypothetical protein TNCV_2876521 [Trichonephila clavipes]|nr:hypothetical protein TNCV_2876521 [Trichonephila clavipes]
MARSESTTAVGLGLSSKPSTTEDPPCREVEAHVESVMALSPPVDEKSTKREFGGNERKGDAVAECRLLTHPSRVLFEADQIPPFSLFALPPPQSGDVGSQIIRQK